MRLAITLVYLLAAVAGQVLVVLSVGKTTTVTAKSAAKYLVSSIVWALVVAYLYVTGVGS